jgi:DNA-directed RNA polymerase specialized sigma subunit
MQTAADTDEALDWVLSKISAAKKQSTLVRIPEAPKLPSFSKLPKKTDFEKKQELKAKQPKEMELWHAYKAADYKSFQGFINDWVGRYKNRIEVPVSVVEAEHKKWFITGLKSYDPKKGAQLNTHLTNYMKKAGRFLDASKNFAYIPENVSKNIGAYNSFKSELSERLGYEPDDQTLHDFAIKEKHERLGVLSLKDIKRLNKEQRKGLINTGYENDLFFPNDLNPREVEVAHLIIGELTDNERAVHEFTLGLNGKPKLAPGKIAKQLKMDNSKVSKLRKSIWGKMSPYLTE